MRTQKGRKQVKILEVGLNSTSLKRVLGFVRNWFNYRTKGDPFLIFTPNPEIVLYSEKDLEYKALLNAADLSIPDGIGLSQAARFLALEKPKSFFVRLLVLPVQGLMVGLSTFINQEWLFSSLGLVRGRDLFLEVVRLANKKGWKVVLVGSRDGSAEKAAERLKKTFKKVELVGVHGPNLDLNGECLSEEDEKVEKRAVETINKFSPEVVFVGFGAPKQEKWAFKMKGVLKTKGIITVGGTFDYVTGKMMLPPKILEELGLEWVWRLIAQPGRLKRILTAFPLFPLRVFWSKLTK